MKDELGGRIMKGLRAKTYSYSKDNNDEDKKRKGTKKCVVKRKLKFQDYKIWLGAAQVKRKIIIQKKITLIDIVFRKIKKNLLKNKLILKTQQRLKSERHNVTEGIDKIALSSNDVKRMRSINLIETCIWNEKI